MHLSTDCIYEFFPMAPRPLMGQGLLIIETSLSRPDTTHSVGLLWTKDQSVAETSTWKHTKFTGGIWTRSPNKRAVLVPRLSRARPQDILSIWPARILGDYLPAYQRGSSVSIRGQFVRDFWSTVWRWDRLFSEYFSFPLSISVHECWIFVIYMLTLSYG